MICEFERIFCRRDIYAFQADIAPTHDTEKYRSRQRERSSEKYDVPDMFLTCFFFGNRNLKYGFGFSRIFIIDDYTVALIMHAILCLLKTFNSQNNRKPLGVERFVIYSPCIFFFAITLN